MSLARMALSELAALGDVLARKPGFRMSLCRRQARRDPCSTALRAASR